MKCADGKVYEFARTETQGRKRSPDKKTNVGLRLYNSARNRIAATGQTEQEFIEEAVYEKLNCCNTEIA